MTKRVCETCRFAKQAGFDNMGWCTHPRLHLGGDAKVFVRLNSLHCRNGWASDLWQPADSREYASSESALAQPLAPVTVDEISAVLGGPRRSVFEPESEPGASLDQDIVVDEATVVNGATGPTSLRNSVKRAHAEMLDRNRESRPSFLPLQGDWSAAELSGGSGVPTPSREARPAMNERSIDVHSGPDNGPSSQPSNDAVKSHRDTGRARPVIGDVAPVELAEIGRPFPKMTHFPDDDIRFSTVPEPVDGFDLPFAGKEREAESARRVVGRAGFDNDDFEFPTWNRDERGDMDPPEPEPRRRAAVPEPSHHVWSERPVRSSSASTRSMSAAAPADIERSFPALPDFFAGQHEAERIPANHVDRVQLPRPERPTRSAAPQPVIDAPDPIVEAEDHVLEDQVLLQADDAGVVYLHWAEIPRMCRTCRDFRPAENGDRGWCTNKWAFSHRRMVDADELPCETSIGGWWLPNDEIWLSTLDVSAHSQPTPLFDQWIAQRVVAERGYEEEELPLRRRKRS